jgi:hypothetical protein
MLMFHHSVVQESNYLLSRAQLSLQRQQYNTVIIYCPLTTISLTIGILTVCLHSQPPLLLFLLLLWLVPVVPVVPVLMKRLV